MSYQVTLGPLLIHQVPFCSPFWTSVTNFTAKDIEEKSLWSQMPSECRTGNVAAIAVACVVSFICLLIHIATIVAYSKLRGDILQRKRNSSIRREKRRKFDVRIIQEAADFAFAMTTQERLRMTFAFTGILNCVLLIPIVIASASVAYSLPFPQSVVNSEDTWNKLHPYGLTVSVLFHLTLTASFCILLLMVIERYRETIRIFPDKFIKSAKDDSSDFYRRGGADFNSKGAKNQSKSWRQDPDVVPRREHNRFGRMQDTFMYAFQRSYTFLDLVMALVVPLISGIVTTISVAVFGSRYEPFGVIAALQPGRATTINGLISYRVGYFPETIYTYSSTIGLLIAACCLLNFLSMLRCHTLMSIAKYLPGYQHSRDLFKYAEGRKSGRRIKPRPVSKIGSDSVRLSRRIGIPVLRNPNRLNRQDLDRMSIDDEMLESSLSSIPLPPAPFSRFSVVSMDNLSLPPPPRPESIVDLHNNPLMSFPSLPSMARTEEDYQKEPEDEGVTAVKAEAFFGNIRQSKVVLAAFLLFLLLSAPLMILFATGTFYPNDNRLNSVLGAPNLTSVTRIVLENPAEEITEKPEIESSAYFGVTSPKVTLQTESETFLKEQQATERKSANQKNWVTTLSGVFIILFVTASVAPFFAYCSASRKFRQEASRFFCFCLLFQWYRYSKRMQERYEEEIARARSNKGALSGSSASRSFRYAGDIRGARNPSSLPRDLRYAMKYPTKSYDRSSLRREKATATRNVSWGATDRYGSSRM